MTPAAAMRRAHGGRRAALAAEPASPLTARGPRARTRRALAAAAVLAGAAAAAAAHADGAHGAFPARVSQGALVVAHVAPGSEVVYAGRTLRVAADGAVAFGVGRDERGPIEVRVRGADGAVDVARIAVEPREWPVERVVGVPPTTVEPPPAVAERIRREQARVAAARERDDARTDFERRFAWPVTGRISGRFGNQRVYVVAGRDVPKSPHSGMDIAVPEGTPVRAPAPGLVTFADADLYLTGGTLLIDHGHGVSSNFLHLSRIDVKVGQHVEQGQIVGAAGHTGRASGPHLHWGMNWFDVRLDPLLALDPSDALSAREPSVDLDGPTALGYAPHDDAVARADVAAALSGVAACAKRARLALRTPQVEPGLVTVREAGQRDAELVLPGRAGAYLFWPGKKPGVAVPDDGPGFAATLRGAAARYYDVADCDGA